MIASTAKMIAAIAIANEGKDSGETRYLDPDAVTGEIETCAKGGAARAPRRAVVAFACSLNAPLLARSAQLNQVALKRLIDAFGFAMPPAAAGGGTPASTAVILGQIAGSPRRVHQMSSIILAALTGHGSSPVRAPTFVENYDFTQKGEYGAGVAEAAPAPVIPSTLIRPAAVPVLKSFLEAPLCYQHQGVPYGTLKSLSNWCAQRRSDLKVHFAKTGTQVTSDPHATVDAWISGGIQFKTGAAYSYVVLAGTGSAPWARDLHAAQVAAPLLEILLNDLAGEAKSPLYRRPADLRAELPAKIPVASLAGQAVETSPAPAK